MRKIDVENSYHTKHAAFRMEIQGVAGFITSVTWIASYLSFAASACGQAVNSGALCIGDWTALMANFGEMATVAGQDGLSPRFRLFLSIFFWVRPHQVGERVFIKLHLAK